MAAVGLDRPRDVLALEVVEGVEDVRGHVEAIGDESEHEGPGIKVF